MMQYHVYGNLTSGPMSNPESLSQTIKPPPLCFTVGTWDYNYCTVYMNMNLDKNIKEFKVPILIII